MGGGATLFMLFVPMFIMLLAGAALIAMWRFSKSRSYPACGSCGYDLSASVGAVTRCPECGAEFKDVGIRPPGESRNKAMLITGLVLVLIPLTCFGALFGMALLHGARSGPPPVIVPAGPPPAPPTVTQPEFALPTIEQPEAPPPQPSLEG